MPKYAQHTLQVDPYMKIVGKMEDEVPAFFKRMRYPFAISKSALFAVGSPHTWPGLLAALVWLTDLLYYTEKAVSRLCIPASAVQLHQVGLEPPPSLSMPRAWVRSTRMHPFQAYAPALRHVQQDSSLHRQPPAAQDILQRAPLRQRRQQKLRISVISCCAQPPCWQS